MPLSFHSESLVTRGKSPRLLLMKYIFSLLGPRAIHLVGESDVDPTKHEREMHCQDLAK